VELQESIAAEHKDFVRGRCKAGHGISAMAPGAFDSRVHADRSALDGEYSKSTTCP